MNNVSLVGRLTKDPELRTASTGNSSVMFTLAVTRQFTNAAGEREADFINCVVWGKSAENLAKYCTKGSQIAVSGRIQTRNYDGQDGRKVYVTEVVANNITFLSPKGSNDGSTYTNQGNYNNNYGAPSFEGNQNYGPVPSFEEAQNYSNVNNQMGTDLTEDPFKDFGSEVVLSDDDLPF